MASERTLPVASQSAGARYRDLLLRGGPFIALLILCAFLSIATPHFATVDNMFNITRQSAFTAILAIGQTFVILTGGIDLSVAAVAALSACVTTVLLTSPLVLFGHDFGILPAPVAITIGLLVGCACGALNGWIIARFKIPDFIATLGTMTVLRGVALIVTDGLPVPSFQSMSSGAALPSALIQAGSGSVLGMPISAIIAVLVALVGFYILRYRALGRAIYAVGGNREAARVSGIDIGRTKILAYMISGLTAAIAGLIMVGRLNSANALMADGEELRSIAAVVIGGTNLFGGEGGVIGSLVGAVIIGVLNNGLNLLNVSPFWQRIVQGLVIVLVVIFDQWRRRKSVNG
ncbi:MAG TPA: ABC transporter permease [Geminicoccus sp.]|uniref:ABC transporter permease n=1 Tax=Geminicoccus sp. TaxID=2024832 RepID=UPI002E341FD6|nr:ABC transporter permease [Geminicoccus sp.]HEX2527102.1 ABC transporter permease [Geminicoccus sp.]